MMLRWRAIMAAGVLCQLLVSGCAQTQQSSEPLSVVVPVDQDCHEKKSLERDLSNHGTYAGANQLYLDGQGRTCRFGK